MKISYAIMVKDEIDYIKNLIEKISEYKNKNDEIIVLHHIENQENLEFSQLQEYLLNNKNISFYFTTHELNSFAYNKNLLNSKCSGDYIFNIDADEIPTDNLLINLKNIIKNNLNIELFFIPRINIVRGIQDEHIKMWNWKIIETEKYGKIINYPDLQGRLFLNNNKIKWINDVHEILIGYKTYTIFPWKDTYDYCIIHDKDINRQIIQNEKYQKMMSYNK